MSDPILGNGTFQENRCPQGLRRRAAEVMLINQEILVGFWRRDVIDDNRSAFVGVGPRYFNGHALACPRLIDRLIEIRGTEDRIPPPVDDASRHQDESKHRSRY